MMKMKNICLVIVASLLLGSCGIYNKYQRPEMPIDSTFRDTPLDTASLAWISWHEIFTDPSLDSLIEQGLSQNTDLRIANLKVDEAQAALRTARLSYIPSLSFGAQGTAGSFSGYSSPMSYQGVLSASWEIDIFGKLTNAKRGALAAMQQSQAYAQAVRTRLISTVASSYYTLLMLDSQRDITRQTLILWDENVQSMMALKQAGLTTQAAVSQAQANRLGVESSLKGLDRQINETENSLSTLLGRSAGPIERGVLAGQQFADHLSAGVPLQLLSNRPDVRQAEYALSQAFYNTNAARSAFYPSISLGGTAGWANSAGTAILNPGGALLSAIGSLTQPIFNRGALTSQLRIAKARQEQAALTFTQSLLNAGAEVNNALVQWQTAKEQIQISQLQIENLELALESTKLLMKHGNTTYLEVLTAQSTLLQAQLTQVTNRFNQIQGVISLYHAIGGGVEASIASDQSVQEDKSSEKDNSSKSKKDRSER